METTHRLAALPFENDTFASSYDRLTVNLLAGLILKIILQENNDSSFPHQLKT